MSNKIYIFLRAMQYFGEPEGRVKIQMMSKNLQRYYTLKCLIRDLLSNGFVHPKFWLAKVFNLSRGRANEASTNIMWYLYSFRAFFVLYEAVLDNKYSYSMSLRWTRAHLYDQIWNWKWLMLMSWSWCTVHWKKQSQMKVEFSVISYNKGELLF